MYWDHISQKPPGYNWSPGIFVLTLMFLKRINAQEDTNSFCMYYYLTNK